MSCLGTSPDPILAAKVAFVRSLPAAHRRRVPPGRASPDPKRAKPTTSSSGLVGLAPVEHGAEATDGLGAALLVLDALASHSPILGPPHKPSQWVVANAQDTLPSSPEPTAQGHR
ncbi:hypothetical protein CEP52_008544 [Fusarium oligoseptatum]|uniref:Uncharacterized protein n=1 Tax=Fusarium oligoseptatum TaxID=2604345 RepID=A0A428THF7_9HYPO|nr:hypothetical protein CEP52_008544 [Fusarium oligoseptatum]